MGIIFEGLLELFQSGVFCIRLLPHGDNSGDSTKVCLLIPLKSPNKIELSSHDIG